MIGISGVPNELEYFLTKKLIPAAISYIGQFLKVKRYASKLLIDAQSCYLATIP